MADSATAATEAAVAVAQAGQRAESLVVAATVARGSEAEEMASAPVGVAGAVETGMAAADLAEPRGAAAVRAAAVTAAAR